MVTGHTCTTWGGFQPPFEEMVCFRLTNGEMRIVPRTLMGESNISMITACKHIRHQSNLHRQKCIPSKATDKMWCSTSQSRILSGWIAMREIFVAPHSSISLVTWCQQRNTRLATSHSSHKINDLLQDSGWRESAGAGGQGWVGWGRDKLISLVLFIGKERTHMAASRGAQIQSTKSISCV